MGFLKALIINVLILVLFITFMPGLLPDVSITKPYKVPKISLDGKFTPNNKLGKLEILFKGDLLGPESFTDDKNFLYTSLFTGDIVKISGKHIVPLVQFGRSCKGIYEEKICGRPLGIRFGNDGYLYAADAYYGIFKVDVNTGEKMKLVSFGQEINGKTAKLPNSVAVSCNGDIYWTDSSSNFLLQDGIFAFLDDPTGRLIHYDAKTGKNKVLIDGIMFANGVALSKNEDFLIVSDARNQILRHYLRGPKAGTTETFVQLPGIPDNIQTDGKSGFLVSVITESNAENPSFLNLFSSFPRVRRFFARSLSLAELGFRFVDKIHPNEICQKTLHFIGHFTSLMTKMESRSVVVHLSENGEILDTLWTDNEYSSFSEAHIVKNYLYLGSPFNNYIGRIPLSEIGWDHLSLKSDSATSVKHSCAALHGNIKKVSREDSAKLKAEPEMSQKSTTHKPSTTTVKPPTQKQAPTTQKPVTQKPITTTQKPPTQKQVPTTQKPSVQKPITTTQKPPTQKQAPTTQKPVTQKPSTTTQKPPTQKQTSVTQQSNTASQKPPQKQAPTTQKPVTQKTTTTTPKPATKPQEQVVKKTETVENNKNKDKVKPEVKKKNSEEKIVKNSAKNEL